MCSRGTEITVLPVTISCLVFFLYPASLSSNVTGWSAIGSNTLAGVFPSDVLSGPNTSAPCGTLSMTITAIGAVAAPGLDDPGVGVGVGVGVGEGDPDRAAVSDPEPPTPTPEPEPDADPDPDPRGLVRPKYATANAPPP